MNFSGLVTHLFVSGDRQVESLVITFEAGVPGSSVSVHFFQILQYVLERCFEVI